MTTAILDLPLAVRPHFAWPSGDHDYRLRLFALDRVPRRRQLGTDGWLACFRELEIPLPSRPLNAPSRNLQ